MRRWLKLEGGRLWGRWWERGGAGWGRGREASRSPTECRLNLQVRTVSPLLGGQEGPELGHRPLVQAGDNEDLDQGDREE